MAFWLILIKLVKLLATIRKYAALLNGLSSGKLVQGIIGDLIVGEVTSQLVKAGVPIGTPAFVEQSKQWVNQVIGESFGDLAKSNIDLLPDAIHQMLEDEIARLVLGKSVGNGKSSVRRQRRSADPVLLHRGEFERASVDLLIRGAGTDVMFRRVYRSGADFLGPFGRGWDHAYNLRILEHDENIVSLLNGDLGVSRFIRHPKTGQAGFDYFTPPNGVHDVIVADTSGSFRLLRASGAVWAFAAAGPREHRLVEIRERGGSDQQLLYDADGRLARININGDGRHLAFAYDSRDRITRIEDHAGRHCDYEYDEFGYLSNCQQWVDVAGKPHLSAEMYDYTTVGALRRLSRVCDEAGAPIVENSYDVDRSSETFGYLISQNTEAGATHFVHELLNISSNEDIDPVDDPVLRIFERGPDGHVIERVFNELGNELLRREDYTDGGRVRSAVIRTRYNADGAIIAKMDPEGGLTQYLYGRDQFDPDRTWSDCNLCLGDVTLQQRMAFGNGIAKVERGESLNTFTQAAEQSAWIAALPDAWVRANAQDAIIKSVYDPITRLLVSQSDPRATVSPNPLHVESAPLGKPAHDPGNPLAIIHARFLTRFEYTPGGLLSATVYPDRTRPLGLGALPSVPVSERIAARDAQGRPMLRVDQGRYAWFMEYFQSGATLAEKARAGFLKRELRPHCDWPLNNQTPDLLEIRREGSWTALPHQLRSDGVAAIEIEIEGARLELWQTVDVSTASNHPAVAVAVDGAAFGTWDQVMHARFIVDGLSRGIHMVRLASLLPRPFSLGRIISHVATDFEVDLLGRIIRETDPRGVTTETTYDALDRVILRAGAAVDEVSSEFNRDGQLVREVTSWRDDKGKPIAGGGVERTYKYSARGLLERETVGAVDKSTSRSDRYYYDQRAQPIGMRDARGVRTTFRYDALGRRTHVVHAACTPDQATEFFRFDRSGRLLLERDPEGGVKRSDYDARGRLKHITDKLGHLTVISHDAAGRELVTRRFARRSDGSYELAHRSENVRDEHGDIVETRIALLDQPLITIAPFDEPDAAFEAALIGGTVQEAVSLYELDAFGRQTKILDPADGLSKRRYDPAGRLCDEWSPAKRRIFRIFDGAGYPRRVYAFDPADSPSAGAVVFIEEYEHDALGRKTLRRDTIGNVWRTAYDSLGHALRTEDPLGTVCTFEHNAFGEEVRRDEGRKGETGPAMRTTLRSYDRSGNLVVLTDGEGRQFQFDFDLRNRQRRAINLSDPADPGTHREYDRASRLIRSVDRTGMIQRHTYDAEGHRILTSFDASAVPPSQKPSALAPSFIAVGYDGLGNPVTHENDWSLIRQVRNSLGLVLSETTTLSGAGGVAARTWTVEQSFDAGGRRTQLKFPSGRIVAYAHDPAGRVTEITDVLRPPSYPGLGAPGAGGVLARFDYAGQRWCNTHLVPVNVTLSAHYDARGQICERIASENGTGDALWRSQLLFDAVGRPAVETALSANGARSRRYEFDRLGQVAGYIDQAAAWISAVSLAPPAHARTPAASTVQALVNGAVAAMSAALPAYTYDAVGNRLMTSEPGLPALPSTPDAGNRYLNVGGTPWLYDLEGRLLADGACTFGYDGDGLLCEESDAGQPASAGFLRDAMGRVLACKTDAGVDYLVYAGRILVARFGAAAPLEAVPGRYADEPLHLAQAGSDTWVIQDGLRTPRLLLRRGPGQVDVVLSHRPFGSPEGASFAEIPFGFAGMLALPGSMLLHATMRSYRPDMGRFLQPDPAGFVDGENRYVYAQNNPLALFDPLGLQSLSPSDLRILDILEKYAGELLKDVTHNQLTASAAGSNKHLEMQFATGHIPITELSEADSIRIAPEIHIDDKGYIVAVDVGPEKAGSLGSKRTVDIAIVKEGVPGGRDGIKGKKAEDVLDFVIDYKTGNASLDKRKELEALLGGKPVVKLTGKAGELAQSLTKRFAKLAAVKAGKQAAQKKVAKWGLKQIPKAIPILGAIFTYSTAEGSQGERIARAAAGEIGWGPFDLEMAYDALSFYSTEMQEMHEEDPDTYYIVLEQSVQIMQTPY